MPRRNCQVIWSHLHQFHVSYNKKTTGKGRGALSTPPTSTNENRVNHQTIYKAFNCLYKYEILSKNKNGIMPFVKSCKSFQPMSQCVILCHPLSSMSSTSSHVIHVIPCHPSVIPCHLSVIPCCSMSSYVIQMTSNCHPM